MCIINYVPVNKVDEIEKKRALMEVCQILFNDETVAYLTKQSWKMIWP